MSTPHGSAPCRALQAGDADGFDAALAGLDQARGAEVTLQVRRVATGLQTALDRFRIDSKLIDLAQRQLPDARHRLAQVLRLSDDAAHRTMDLVEQCAPLADQTAEEAERLLGLHEANGLAPPLEPQILAFLKRAGVSMAAVRSNLGEVVLAQGHQDLSGQIIRGVMPLVSELEQALGGTGAHRRTGPRAAARQRQRIARPRTGRARHQPWSCRQRPAARRRAAVGSRDASA